jgi:hypothetical protein
MFWLHDLHHICLSVMFTDVGVCGYNWLGLIVDLNVATWIQSFLCIFRILIHFNHLCEILGALDS